jgi:hypothetical protein
MIYKGKSSTVGVLVVPSPGRGLSPVLIGEVVPENVVEKVLPVVEGMRRLALQPATGEKF